MSMDGHRTGWQRRCLQALGNKLEHGRDLLSRYFKLSHHFVDAQILQVFNHGRDR